MTEPQFETRGLHNWRNLFRKPNGYEWTIFVMLLLAMLLSYTYNKETAQCRTALQDIPKTACQICSIQTERAVSSNAEPQITPPLFDTLNLSEDSSKRG